MTDSQHAAPADETAPGALLIGAFRQVFVEHKTGDDIVQELFERPALLWPERWPELEAYADSLDDQARGMALAGLKLIRTVAADLEKQGGWYEGGGPVERLATRVLNGEMSDEEAAAAVAAPAISGLLSPDYVRRLGGRTVFRANDGRWQQAVPLGRLLVAAADAYPQGAARDAMRREAIIGWVEVVTAACIDVPDGRLFRDAKARGEAWLAERREAGDAAVTGEALFKIGVLHLDPYQAGGDFRNFKAGLRSWQQRFVDLYGEVALADENRRMPEPLATITLAAAYLGEAADLQQGEDRGLSLKAKVDALILIEVLDGPSAKESVRACAEEALSLLPRERFPSQTASLQARLRWAGGEVVDAGPAAGDELDETDPGALIAEHGYGIAVERYRSHVGLWQAEEPERAIAATRRVWPHLNEADKKTFANLAFTAFIRQTDTTSLLARNGDDYAAAAAATAQLAPADRLPDLIGLAAKSTGDSREDEGIPILDEALRLAMELAPDLVEMLTLLGAWLHIGAGVNLINAGQWEGTTQHYCDALGIFVRLNALEGASDLLAQAGDAALHEGQQGLMILTVTLGSLTPRLSRADMPRLGDQVHAVWQMLIAQSVATGRINPLLFDLQIQASKGATLAVMLHAGSTYIALDDPAALDLLQRRSAIGVEEGLGDLMLNEHVLIAHAVGLDPIGGPTGAVERLAQRFDAHVSGRLAAGGEALEAYLLEAEWEALLDPADLVVNQYFGPNAKGEVAAIVATRSRGGPRMTMGVAALPVKQVELTVQDRVLEASLFGLHVASLREALQEAPGPALATDDALEELAAIAANAAGMFPILRDELAAGRTHLCFIPHGAYHFCPLHLLPYEDGILADRWTVSYAPHPALLRRRAGTRPAAGGFAAFGLSFEHREHGQNPLPAAAEEARAIAAVMNGKAYVDAAATEAQLIESLRTCGAVHLATHGRQNAFAPFLQRLFMAPAAGSDGILHAYELLGLDLRQLDLVTLSACETALGRFDINDNLRGLVATLLIAGVPTVISTLWPVRDSVTRRFFELLYGRLAAGDGKLAAFRAAQTGTRADHPAYRDWGAFVFAGCW